MPHVDTNAPLVTNSDAAMWRQDHASACRYIEALLAERETWAPVMEAAKTWYESGRAKICLAEPHCNGAWERYEAAHERLVAAAAAALKEGEDE